MMYAFFQKLTTRSYAKRFLWIAVAAAVLTAATAVLGPVKLHKQITELKALEQAHEEREALEERQESLPGKTPDSRSAEKKDRHEEYENEADFESVLKQLSPVPAGTKIIFAVLAAFAILLLLFYWLTTVAWLYKMAVLHGLNRALWPILGCVFNLLVVPALLIVLYDPRRTGKTST